MEDKITLLSEKTDETKDEELVDASQESDVLYGFDDYERLVFKLKEEQEMVNKIKEYICKELNSVYCHNCRGNSLKGKEHENFCDDCHRKYMNWAISKKTALQMANKIIEIIETEE